MAYISDSVTQVFLSEEALKDLDILPRKWPKQENVGVCTMDSVVNKDSEIVSCSDKTEVLSSEKMRCEVNTPGHASDGDQVHLEVLGLGEVPIEATDKWEEEIKAEEMEGTIQGRAKGSVSGFPRLLSWGPGYVRTKRMGASCDGGAQVFEKLPSEREEPPDPSRWAGPAGRR